MDGKKDLSDVMSLRDKVYIYTHREREIEREREREREINNTMLVRDGFLIYGMVWYGMVCICVYVIFHQPITARCAAALRQSQRRRSKPAVGGD